jgi:uncharacterized protein (TIGR00297 family)
MLDIGILTFIIIFSFIAYKLNSLTASGAIAATLVGSTVYLGLGIDGFIILGTFFVSSSLISFLKNRQKEGIEETLEKGSRRDYVQVMANGGIAAICCLFFIFSKDIIWIIAYLTSLSSATGDTWSSEMGPLSKHQPISVKNFKKVQPGTSGAVSLLGTFSALAGVGLITVLGYLIFPITWKMAWIIFFYGIVGNGIDTFLGAFLQRTFRCPTCHMMTEKTYHCETKTKMVSGISFMNNDAVNFLSSFIAPVFSVLTYLYFH